MEKMRVRFAPSPTGPFHIGGARSALFNWLLAKKTGGDFVLRIEDTDRERSSQESEDNIKAALKWLGMDWNEGIDVGGDYGPYKQTERLETYRQYAQQLVAAGKAYYCYCSDEELEAQRQAFTDKGETPRYAGVCSNLTPEQQAELVAQGRKPTIRFKVPANQDIVIADLVRGNVVFESNGIGDFVIVKSDGIPTYNFAVVIDDALMKITHVIRAEEHLSNTPRQVLIYQALQLPLPVFGHISLILGKDRTKMSKRHGATSVDQYRQLGYLPQALVNFLALLGWAPSGEQELFSTAELIQEFSMEHVAKNPAVFDVDKLNWINQQYIRALNPEEYCTWSMTYVIAAGYATEQESPERLAWLKKVILMSQEYITYLSQVPEQISMYFTDEFEFENAEAQAVLQEDTAAAVIELFLEKLQAAETLEAATVQQALKATVKETKLGGKKVYMPIRVALTGNMHGPDLTQIIPLFGLNRTIERINGSMKKI